MATSAPPSTDPARAAKLTKFFDSVVRGVQPLKTAQNGNLFLEALCVQLDAPTCVQKLVASPKGVSSLQTALRFNCSVPFHNGSATRLLKYMQSPSLKFIHEGTYLHQIVSKVVDPPIFWDPFLESFRNGLLNVEAQQCVGWLLSELLCLPEGAGIPYLPLAQDSAIQKIFQTSTSFDVRTIGQKVKHVASAFHFPNEEDVEFGAGGRHRPQDAPTANSDLEEIADPVILSDNDAVDFREIAIHPTADEMLSEEQPFLRLAQTIDTPGNENKRLAIHLDNQFRLLREDMLIEMRDEFQAISGKKQRRHRGLIVDGLTLLEVDCGDHKNRKPLPWALRLQCTKDLPQLGKVNTNDRRDYFVSNRNIFKHQSLVCLIIDGEIASFPTIHRELDQLARKPPVVTLQFTGKASTVKTLLMIKTMKNMRLVQTDTAVFAFEPVLKGLQELREMPLVDELLLWGPESDMGSPSHVPKALIEKLEKDPTQALGGILGLTKSVTLDESQSRSLLTGLKQKVSLIQGPPGTGKSFIGALIAKSIYQYTDKVILVVCFKNHALDQFLEDLLDIGIPSDQMVRLGGQSTPRTKSMQLYEQPAIQSRRPFKTIDELRGKADMLASRLYDSFSRYYSTNVQKADLMVHLEFLSQDANFFEAFSVPQADDGSVMVGRGGKAINEYYLLDRWSAGEDAGIFIDQVLETSQRVWQMPLTGRQAAIASWKQDIFHEQVLELQAIAEQYNVALSELNRLVKTNHASVIAARRIIACTTTAAAKYVQDLQAASLDVILVEEAGEILESHILTALGPRTQQLILIGDHQQLRPKVNYELSVEKGEGYDLNRSLFERLVVKGFPHQTLTQQHRMRPEISALVRELTYPDLVDAPRTQSRPSVRGLRDDLIFLAHDHPEVDAKEAANWKDMSSISSKQNIFEVDLVLKVVRYLAQQGYGTDEIVVLTPYLGQLQLLRTVLGKDSDPVLNDLDSFDLVRAGLMPAASARVAQKKIRLATIDNYQGEESDIVVASLTRSNPRGDIGFMAFPQRLNVLLSRARNGLILIGNVETFLHARQGKEQWTQLFDMLKQGKHIYEGLPVKCERHPDRTALLRKPVDFENECPDGGCDEPCNIVLTCGIHLCPQKCHQLHDHSKVPCQHVVRDKCPKGHEKSWQCHRPPPNSCSKCEADARKLQKELQRSLKLQEKRDREEQEHFNHMAKLDIMLADERQRIKDAEMSRDRAIALELKEQDLLNARALTIQTLNSPTQSQNRSPSTDSTNSSAPHGPSSTRLPGTGTQTKRVVNATPLVDGAGTSGPKWKVKPASPARQEWERQKNMENARNASIDSIMDMIGLEEVKLQILRIKAKIETSFRQSASMKDDRLNVVLLGNPGTGKTTVARLYAKALNTLGALPGDKFVETTGALLANEGIDKAKEHLEAIRTAGGGVLFLDEAYQLADKHNLGGRPVLDYLLAEMENNVGTIVFIFAGYNKNMEKFFEHNPGLHSHIPYYLQFRDYDNEELLWMLQQIIAKRYKSKMAIEDSPDGLYMRIVITRLGRQRDRPGFGNARALQTVYSSISERQAERLTLERKNGLRPDDFYLCKEDLIGPDPSKAILKSTAWEELQKMIGLDVVKQSVHVMIDRVSANYLRELKEQSPLEVSLNRVFLGSPGTGKTSVAKLYGRILADIGILSNGEVVVKNPADFVGQYIGHSESNTKAILATTVGKVLIIDEAYMLYSSSGTHESNTDSFKQAVVDTIVAEVQSVPGEDRCVLLLGYEAKMVEMFQNVNPGLSRRFAIESAFRFEDFTDEQLLEILELKLTRQDLDATDDAKKVAIDVLSRGRNRPNFGNAGEVENLLGLAKGRHQLRHSTRPVSERSSDVVFEPQDFDPNYQRGLNASTNLRKLFEDVVGCEEIIAKLSGYQEIAHGMKSQGLEPRGMIPMNFLFKGPPGTGKTTTARKVGQVFYDLGFLSDVEVVECSASDLIGSYIGHTGPKTRKQLEKGLGKVLFVDEAYRLAEGHFASEAIAELVDQLTKDLFMNKLVVILAGYDEEINKLLAVNPGLSSRFPEEIIFKNMRPEQCLEVLERTIKQQKIQTPPLTDAQSHVHGKMVNLINQFGSLPHWGNARDMKTLAMAMVGFVFKATSPTRDPLAIHDHEILTITEELLQERRDRCAIAPSTPQCFGAQKAAEQVKATPPPPPASGSHTGPSTDKTNDTSDETTHSAGGSEQVQGSSMDIERDVGVSDVVWAQLQADKDIAESVIAISDHVVHEMKNAFADAERFDDQQRQALKRLEQAEVQDEAEAQDLHRKREEARLHEQVARNLREEAKKELERMRPERAKQKREKEAQNRLREMGVCVQGFPWIKQSAGYRCAGGFHYVSDAQLGSF